MMNWEQQIASVENLIQSGQTKQAVSKIKNLRKKYRTPRRFIAKLSSLARRGGNILLAMQLLYPIVRSKNEIEEVSDEEKLQYAANLIRLGIRNESIKMLNELDGKIIPQVYLQKAFACYLSWDFKEAIVELRKYCLSNKITHYQKLIGQYNLASSCLHIGEEKEANSVLQVIIEEARENGHHFLLDASLQMLAQGSIVKGDIKKGFRYLNQIYHSDDFQNNNLNLQVRKWYIIGQLLHNRDEGRDVDLHELIKIKKQAKTNFDWETVRHCDQYIAILSQDTDLFHQIYIGSKSPSIRNTLNQYFDQKVKPSLVYHSEGLVTNRWVDLNTAKNENDEEVMPIGSIFHRLLLAFAQDIYKPLKLPQIHEVIYMNSHYDIHNAPARVRVNISRFNFWSKENRLDFQIVYQNGFYQLKMLGDRGIKIHLAKPNDLDLSLAGRFQRVKNHFETGRSFTCQDCCELLNISNRTVQRFLKELTSRNLLQVKGKGPATRYHWE